MVDIKTYLKEKG